MVYLDYNATTPIDPAVAEAMKPFICEQFGNPSSGHPLGRAAKQAVESARASLARLIGAKAEEIVFTSGGTESSNTAIKWAARRGGAERRHVITTAVEHPATIEPLRWLEGRGIVRTEVRVDGTGLVDPDEVRRAIRPDTGLISVIHAQNEVGSVQPVAEIGRIAREAGILFHVDAAQSTGKIPFNVADLAVDLLSIAGHKMYAPKGIGALYVRAGLDIEPLIHGAAQESGRRAGTENVIMAVGLGKAAELAAAHLPDRAVAGLRDYFWQRLSERFGGRVLLNGHSERRLPGTLSVSFPGLVGGEILARLPEVCASTGAACHSGGTKPSAVLLAMGFSVQRAVGTIRFSLGRPTRREELDQVVELLAQAVGIGPKA
jgi:cysteine desulfurase